MPMAIRAVLTGDIVNSTQLGQATEKKLLKSLQQMLAVEAVIAKVWMARLRPP